MPNDLGIQSTTVTAFLNDKLTPEQIKELQNVMNLDPKLHRKVFIFWGQFGPGPKLSPPKLALQSGSPKLALQNWTSIN